MKLFLFVTFLIFMCNDLLDAQNQTDTVKVCHGMQCPQNTTYCQKRVSTTLDGKNFSCTLDCLDSNITSVASFNMTRPTPFGYDSDVEINIEGFSLSSVCEVPANETENLKPSYCPESDATTNKNNAY